MNQKTKIIISLLSFTIVGLSILLIIVTKNYIRTCNIIGIHNKLVEETAMEIQRENDIKEDKKKNINLVTLTLENITPLGATLIITDNNENPYNWIEGYAIKKKDGENYIDIANTNKYNMNKIELNLDNQYRQVINWEETYGKLEKGIYIIEKTIITTNSVIDFRSKEFEI